MEMEKEEEEKGKKRVKDKWIYRKLKMEDKIEQLKEGVKVKRWKGQCKREVEQRLKSILQKEKKDEEEL